MLYVKLTLRNLQRSMKEYAIFMLTMVISMMLMYSFMAVAFSEQVHLLRLFWLYLSDLYL